ncbi:MAG: restriction endonuclease subunit S [Candidatus Moranbacteria bacterium]|nr:restriction endonuclease subunit S [Candidatus Moranbacteria bacterium]
MSAHAIIQKSQLEGATRLDAEYYQPEFLVSVSNLRKFELQLLEEMTSKMEVGFVSSMASHFCDSGVPLLRTQNVGEFVTDFENGIVYIDEEFHKKLEKSQVYPGYVLLARSGSIGNASVVTKNHPVANSADIILIEPKENVLPEYLAAFLNSRYGRFQIERGSSGGLQGHMNLFSLEKIMLPFVSLDTQQRISMIVLQGLDEFENSRSLYQKADSLLLEELGLEDFDKRENLFSITNLSEVQAVHRIDAEYFQVKYEKLIEIIKQNNAKKLGDLASMKKGVEVGAEEYREEGKVFIRVSSMTKFGIVKSDQKYLSDKLYESLKNDFEPKKGEILLTKDATLGVACVLNEDIQGIISGGTLRLKLENEEVESEYLALCLNSIIGQMQAERDAGGSIIAHWKPEQIKNVVIPILPKKIQEEIASLVQRSHEARKKSKQLLEEAKRKVEEMIEKGGE